MALIHLWTNCKVWALILQSYHTMRWQKIGTLEVAPVYHTDMFLIHGNWYLQTKELCNWPVCGPGFSDNWTSSTVAEFTPGRASCWPMLSKVCGTSTSTILLNSYSWKPSGQGQIEFTKCLKHPHIRRLPLQQCFLCIQLTVPCLVRCLFNFYISMVL